MNGSEQLDLVASALVAASKDLRNPKADSKATVPTKSGGSYSYQYLSLPTLLEVVRAVFRDHDLTVIQEVSQVNGVQGVGIVTRILHTSGQWIDTGPLVMPAAGTPQEVGSAITYGRRYALAAAVGLAPDEDDDAERAQYAAPHVSDSTAWADAIDAYGSVPSILRAIAQAKGKSVRAQDVTDEDLAGLVGPSNEGYS